MTDYVIPYQTGRGAGLGNELIVWAKAFLAASAVGARALPPVWGLNSREYWRNFRTSRLDWLPRRGVLSLYPVHVFRKEDFERHYHPDFGEAFGAWYASAFAARSLVPRIFVVEGMWGGYLAIERARTFLYAQLLNTANTVCNLLEFAPKAGAERITRVGIHYRSGDFGEVFAAGGPRWNRRLPIEWYASVMKSITEQLQGPVEFVVVTDASHDETAPLMSIGTVRTTSHQRLNAASDLLLLSSCDLILPSLSSFSMLAILLGDASYVWPRNHLVEHGEFLSLWGDEAEQLKTTAPTMLALAHVNSAGGRCVPLSPGQRLPQQLIERIWNRRSSWHNDLIRFGVVKG